MGVSETTGTDRPSPPGRQEDPVVLAIERVLRAESDGEARLRKCRAQAQALIAAAREQAAAITKRTDARLSKLHAAHSIKVSAEIANLPPARATARETIDDAALARIIRRLAAKLTGAP